MKVKLEKPNNGYYDPITVSFIPSKFEIFLGFRDETVQFSNSGNEYIFWGGGNEWLNYPDMTVHGRSSLLDDFSRRSKNKKGYIEINDCVREYGWAFFCLLGCLFLSASSWLCFFRIYINIDKYPMLILCAIVGLLLGIVVLLLFWRMVVLLVKGCL